MSSIRPVHQGNAQEYSMYDDQPYEEGFRRPQGQGYETSRHEHHQDGLRAAKLCKPQNTKTTFPETATGITTIIAADPDLHEEKGEDDISIEMEKITNLQLGHGAGLRTMAEYQIGMLYWRAFP
ncbi:hypothetical protein GLAREA_08133 [Glarea lozoyensis ATCC 20868]|uniref:Uncharacterized protein n=1 Tax=Glarea lozoyensis (strain ATCC 20868 / MF5171) TaxID=1116229 RepID=S3CCN3_GLAL2|nr:uncharacterized protein GLAREA_08133 [Glarea lozoyensis ATCC 20868]EPE24282.1 hypothetical protein GLAREA_08133 [Glarea lozoyensis ATCC 20868]